MSDSIFDHEAIRRSLQREIDDLLDKGAGLKKLSFTDPKQAKANKTAINQCLSRIDHLRFVSAYLSHHPTREHVTRQLQQQEDLLIKIDGGFAAWRKLQQPGQTVGEYKSEYNKQRERSKVAKQVKTLKYILSL